MVGTRNRSRFKNRSEAVGLGNTFQGAALAIRCHKIVFARLLDVKPEFTEHRIATQPNTWLKKAFIQTNEHGLWSGVHVKQHVRHVCVNEPRNREFSDGVPLMVDMCAS